jgi:hypothetical protein
MESGAKTRIVIVLTLSLSVCTSAPAWAGGELGDARDHVHEGLAIFGFVKDTAGKAIRDAKVTADIKGLGSVIARTDATGVYKFPGFGKGITQNQVSISCSKDGYKQTRTLNRTSPAKKAVTAIEIECTMQPAGTK